MQSFKIEILNPKALKLIRGMQDLDLIKVSENPASKLTAYLAKMRRNAANAPSPEVIAGLVRQVRTERYAKK